MTNKASGKISTTQSGWKISDGSEHGGKVTLLLKGDDLVEISTDAFSSVEIDRGAFSVILDNQGRLSNHFCGIVVRVAKTRSCVELEKVFYGGKEKMAIIHRSTKRRVILTWEMWDVTISQISTTFGAERGDS